MRRLRGVTNGTAELFIVRPDHPSNRQRHRPHHCHCHRPDSGASSRAISVHSTAAFDHISGKRTRKYGCRCNLHKFTTGKTRGALPSRNESRCGRSLQHHLRVGLPAWLSSKASDQSGIQRHYAIHDISRLSCKRRWRPFGMVASLPPIYRQA